MPTIAVNKAALFEELGKEFVINQQGCSQGEKNAYFYFRYTTEEFDELCFEFGMRQSLDCLLHQLNFGRHRAR